MTTYILKSPRVHALHGKSETIRLLRDSARLEIIYNAVKIIKYIFDDLDEEQGDETILWRIKIVKQICSRQTEIFDSLRCVNVEATNQQLVFRTDAEDVVQIDLECASLGAHLRKGTDAIRKKERLPQSYEEGSHQQTSETLEAFQIALETLNEMAGASPREFLKFDRDEDWRAEYIKYTRKEFRLHALKEWDLIADLTGDLKEYSEEKIEKVD